MLRRGLTSSEILRIAKFTIANEATGLVTEGTCQAQNTSIASMSIGEQARSAASTVYDDKRNCGEEAESVGFVNPVLVPRHIEDLEHAFITMHEEYADAFLATSMGANDQRLALEVGQEGKEIVAVRNMAYNSEGGEHLCQGSVPQQHKLSSLDAKGQEKEALADSRSPVTNITGKKSVMMADIIEWLQNNDMATLSDIVNAFGYCEAKHLLFLLLELLESSIIVEHEGVLKFGLEQSANRLEVPRRASSQAISNPSIRRRMHRALCLKAVVLNVVVHEPKRSVEFMIRSIKPCNRLSTVYHVRIFKYPSCTCPDFVLTVEAGFDYIPCKHLFYVYMVQLGLDKDLEHLMLQRVLMEADLERILEGHY